MQYKKLIQRRIATLKKKDPKIRNFHIANALDIEASYLSRFFSDDSVHFSDELLFLLLIEIQMSHSEIEQVLTLSELERCHHPLRKRYLEERMSALKLPKVRHELDKLKQEILQILGSITEKMN